MNKTTPGPCKEVTIGATPHGGTYMVAYYFDSKYAPVPKNRATRIIVHEYDEKNRSVYRDYVSCGPNDEEEFAAMEAYELAERPEPRPANPAQPRRRENGAEGAPRRHEGQRPPRSRQDRYNSGAPRPKGPEDARPKERVEEKKPHQRPKQGERVPREGEKPNREARPQQKPRQEGARPRPEGGQKTRPEGQRPRTAEKPKTEGEKRPPEGNRRPRRRPNRKPEGPQNPEK